MERRAKKFFFFFSSRPHATPVKKNMFLGVMQIPIPVLLTPRGFTSSCGLGAQRSSPKVVGFTSG